MKFGWSLLARSLRSLPILFLLGLGLGTTAGAQQLELLYQQTARPALSQVATVRKLAFDWGGIHFLLDQGRLWLGAPISGRIITAVFLGSGGVEVRPPEAPAWRQPIERNQMERFLGRSAIEGDFTQAVFYFADQQAFLRALGDGAHFSAATRSDDGQQVSKEWAQVEQKHGSTAIARMMRALGEPAPSQLFLAEVKARQVGWVEFQFDPGRPEPLRVSDLVEMPDSHAALDEIWTEFAPVGETSVPRPSPVLDDYRLAVEVTGNLKLSVTARFTLAQRSAGMGQWAPYTGASRSGTRGAAALGPASIEAVLLGLDPHLRIAGVTEASGAALEWFQPPDPADWFYLRLPHPLQPGQPLSLTVRYQGEGALLPAPVDPEWISAPAWYPVLPFGARNSPAHFTVRVTADEKYRVLTTETSSPVRAAGFSVGEDQASERRLTLADGEPVSMTVTAPAGEDPEALMPLAGAKLSDVLNFMGSTFGPYPYADVGLTISGAGSPSPLPGLVEFDPRAFLDLSPDLTELSPALSAAGQWWGGEIVPATPHDEWLVQGLLEASGLLYQEARYGRAASFETVRGLRQWLLTANPQTHHVPALVGPLWLGAERLDSRNDSGLDLLRAKGGYIIYMLRQMMIEPLSRSPDARFIALLRDFTATCRGGEATTAGFQQIAEKYMTPAMDLDHNHKLNWFFQPWIEGDATPRLTFHAQNAAPVNGIAQVTLTVENPQHWRGLLPVYLFKDEDTWVRGLMPITHDHEVLAVPAPFTPRYVEANHFDDILVQIQQ